MAKKTIKPTDSEIMKEAYKQMYAEADPKGDIDKIIKTGEGKMPNFFMAYYLPEERQEQIIKKILDKHKIKKEWKRGSFSAGILLGAAPCSCRETMLAERKDYEKRLKAFLKGKKKQNITAE